ncbi:MAG: GTPase HflX, partial [Deltaproteobacteria bacterium]|nr:GTPase HflX [Deltaproteobacteria bacterium]
FAAFRATFDETQDADLLLHVIDASDPCRSEHVDTTEKLLVDLGLERVARILVFNKCDRLTVPHPTLATRGVPISAIDPGSLGGLERAIEERIAVSHPMLQADDPTSSPPA